MLIYLYIYFKFYTLVNIGGCDVLGMLIGRMRLKGLFGMEWLVWFFFLLVFFFLSLRSKISNFKGACFLILIGGVYGLGDGVIVSKRSVLGKWGRLVWDHPLIFRTIIFLFNMFFFFVFYYFIKITVISSSSFY